MGMALPKLDGGNRFGVTNIRAEKASASMSIGAYEIIRRPAEIPRLHLWGLVGRWISLPTSVRRVLSAALVLACVGSFYAVANIQLESAKEKIEMARSSQVILEDKLTELKPYTQAGFNSYSDFGRKGLK
jgi:hypothetical protein